jgi:hypothetical protein
MSCEEECGSPLVTKSWSYITKEFHSQHFLEVRGYYYFIVRGELETLLLKSSSITFFGMIGFGRTLSLAA